MYEYRANILRVVDGDTVDVMLDLGFGTHFRQRLRLRGIDAPEKRGADKADGMAAKHHLEKLIETHAPIVVRTQKDARGTFGRYLATLWGHAHGVTVSLNQQMIDDGFAVPYH